MARLLAPKAFTPSREDPVALIRRTVGRKAVIERIMGNFKQAATSKSRQHMLLIGPRGAGKSHLLEVVLHQLLEDPLLAISFQIARLPEDAVGIVSAADVGVAILESLAGVSAEQLIRAREARRSKQLVAIESIIAEVVGDKVLLLVVENLDRIFHALGESGQGDIRAWIEGMADVLVLGTAPQLFRGVDNRKYPWFGSFQIEHLEPLNVEEGKELIKTLALDSDDHELARYLDSSAAIERLRTVHHLAGGSPRIWTIFASSLSLETLDALVPAVEDLFEQLVPYYQQRLWELSAIDQKLLSELTLGNPTATVSELAAASGIDPGVTAATLKRLAEANWVQCSKIPGTDQRNSYYEVREPLLRHHFQYRNNQREELRLIVDLIQSWFSESDRRRFLLEAPVSSIRESYLACTLGGDLSARFDRSYANRDIADLQATARLWANGDDDGIGNPFCGAVLDAMVTGVLDSPDSARAALEKRKLGSSALHLLECGLRSLNGTFGCDAESSQARDSVGFGLDALAAAPEGSTNPTFELIAAAWNGKLSPRTAFERLEALAIKLPPTASSRLSLSIEHEAACWQGQCGKAVDSAIRFGHLLVRAVSILGATHPDTIAARFGFARRLGESGQFADAAGEIEKVVTDRTEILGANHPDTLNARHDHAYLLGQSGQAQDAADLFEKIVTDQTVILKTDHPDTLRARNNHAHWLGEAGRVSEAIELNEKLVADCLGVLGEKHAQTLAARNNQAYLLGKSGRVSEAIELYEKLVGDCIGTLGENHLLTLAIRRNHANRLGEAGRVSEVVELFETLVVDHELVFGTDHPDTLRTRHSHAYGLAMSGQVTEAIKLFEILFADRTVLLGADHPDTLITRDQLIPLKSQELEQSNDLSGLVELYVRNAAEETPRRLVLLSLARLQVRLGLKKVGNIPWDNSAREVEALLERVGLHGDGSAFAALPQEIRSMLMQGTEFGKDVGEPLDSHVV
jgi:tetratricopeptide (TPR) repeat protein/DNA-binding MarR family transcriptional regulator